jgi:hypothetical protein
MEVVQKFFFSTLWAAAVPAAQLRPIDNVHYG